MRPKNLKVVEVIWEDSSGSHGWQKHEDISKLARIYSVGYVIRSTKKSLTLGFGMATNEKIKQPLDCTGTIPKSAIRKITVLRDGGTKASSKRRGWDV